VAGQIRVGPEYQRLMEEIRSKIASGEYAIGQAIPSTKELHRQTGMSIPVVRRAVSQLQSDGILVGHPGKGVYVRATPSEVASEQQDVKALSEELAGLQHKVRDLAERADNISPADLTQRVADLEDAVSRILEANGRVEANLIDLFGKLGYSYSQGGTHDGAKATAGRGRSRR
jgi:DNA-binding GntR family transcriptional regulator